MHYIKYELGCLWRSKDLDVLKIQPITYNYFNFSHSGNKTKCGFEKTEKLGATWGTENLNIVSSAPAVQNTS